MTKTKAVNLTTDQETIRQLVAQERLIEALELAKNLPQVGIHQRAFRQAWQAYTNPEFYLARNIDPQKLVIRGIGSLRAMFQR